MTDIIVIAVIVLIVGGALAYIVKAKKNGKNASAVPMGTPAPPRARAVADADATVRINKQKTDGAPRVLRPFFE